MTIEVINFCLCCVFIYLLEFVTTVSGSYLKISTGLSYGKLDLYNDVSNTTGQICSLFWGKEEARVACRELGYQDGVPATYDKDNNSLSLVITYVSCSGLEDRIENCNMNTTVCELERRAGVVCFNSSGITISISDGNYGRVNIEIDNEIGTICDTGWSNEDAEVICRYLGFATGTTWGGQIKPGQGHVFLSDVDCTGKETYITECQSSGWRNVMDADCLNHSKDAGVKCYGSVRVSGGITNEFITMGRVEVYQSTRWTNLCSSTFDQTDANVVCTQLGYFRARVLSTGLFGTSPFRSFTTGISCYGDETDLLDCPHTIADCDYSGYASVVCIKENVTDDFEIFIKKGYTGEVKVLQYGINGTVCKDGWDSNDAKVICHQNGYLGGQVYGTQKLQNQIDPIWLTDVICKENEGHINECGFSINQTRRCSSKVQPAGVICYNETGMEVRLSGTTQGKGRVEVGRDGVWGTVCDSKWSIHDAMVVCEQLGFGAGSAKTSSFYGKGTGPIFIDELECDGTELSIFACPNRGWAVSDTACSSHRKDAGVSCQPWSQLSSYSKGIVSVWKRTSYQYGLVCADTFDDTAATVVCKDLTMFQKGISHCCSAYGPENKPYTINHVKCLGTETSLEQCDYIKSDTCLNGTYASVICTNHIPPKGSGISFHIIGGEHGYVLIDYASHPGIICSEGFDNNDASVMCRQVGYALGISYNHNTATSSFTNTVRWLSHINCNGTETYLHECGNLNFGKIGVCSVEKGAGVICTTNDTASTDVEIRLINGSSNMDGRVELNILGKWRTIASSSLTQHEANVACRMAGFGDKIIATFKDYGNGEISPLISFVKCSGAEKSLLDCVLELGPVNPSYEAMGVICRFAPPSEVKVRLDGGATYLEGRVEIEVYGEWGTICSSGLTRSEAEVVCRMLGFPNGTVVTSGRFGDGGLDPKLSRAQCVGSEHELSDCVLEVALPNTNCSAMGIICQPPVHLVHGEKHYGILEVYRENNWWKTCASGMTEKVADVVCNELGYTNGTTLCCSPFGVSHNNRTLYSVNCNETVSTLNECTIQKFYNTKECHLSELYTSLLCHNDEVPDLTVVQLGGDDNFGEVVVNSHEIKGSLCSESWSYEEAIVTCRRLGYSNGSAYSTIPEDTTRSGKLYWTSQIQCTGKEPDLDSCKYSSIVSDRTCFDKGTAAVYCYDNEYGVRYRVVGMETSSDRGFVEINLNGVWKRICSTDWGNTEASVLCKELGYASGNVIQKNITSEDVGWLYEVRYKCSGKEGRLEDCPHSTWMNVTLDMCLHQQNHVNIQCYHSVIPKLPKESSKTWVWILVAVLAVIIVILVIVILIYRRKNAVLKHLHDSHNQASFNHSVMRQSNDGSFQAENPLAECEDDRYPSADKFDDDGYLIPISTTDNKTIKNYSKDKNDQTKGPGKCVVCDLERSDYLTVVFQKSLKNKDSNNQENEIESDDILHICSGCYNADRKRQEPLYVSLVASQKMKDISGSRDPNSKTAAVASVDIHTQKDISQKEDGVSTVKPYDYVTFQNVWGRQDNNSREQMADSISSLPHRGEIGYPADHEVTEL